MDIEINDTPHTCGRRRKFAQDALQGPHAAKTELRQALNRIRHDRATPGPWVVVFEAMLKLPQDEQDVLFGIVSDLACGLDLGICNAVDMLWALMNWETGNRHGPFVFEALPVINGRLDIENFERLYLKKRYKAKAARMRCANRANKSTQGQD
jgi:hypothetical protein